MNEEETISPQPEDPPAEASASVPSSNPLEAFRKQVARIEDEIGLVLVGQHGLVELMLASLLVQGHMLIEGVPGVAKTLAAKLLARSINTGFSRIQFTPDLMPADVLGTTVYNDRSGNFEFRPGPIFSQLVLIDEINRAPAKTQSALFEVMEERQVTMDGTRYPMQEPFLVMATQNPIEQEGTYRLPEAQLDRFLFKIEVGYPSAEEEAQMLARFHQQAPDQRVEAIHPVLSGEEVRKLQETVRGLHVEPGLQGYVVDIVQRTRSHPGIFLGASPRASLNLLQAAKAIAAMRGRDFVTPEDIQRVCVPVLQHRILLTPEKEMEGTTAAQVVQQMVQEVDVPR